MAQNRENHVMLSYNWGSQALVSKVYDILKDEGIQVWMDVNGGMGDNLNISMAEGVENAAVVCCFMTPAYQKSRNCRLELEYANKLAEKNGIRIIPCMIGDKNDTEDDKWDPDDWLGLITASLNYVSFRDDSDASIQLKARELIDRIKNQPSASPKEVPVSINLLELIKHKYLRENQIKRILNEESFPIEQSYINLAMVETKEQQEKEKKLKEQDIQRHDHILGTFEEIYGAKKSIDIKSIFEQCKNQTKKVLVLGRAGIGKSTFCQYATYQWAKGELWPEYQLLILVYLRKLTDSRYPPGKKYSPVDLVKGEYFAHDSLSKEDTKRFEQHCDKGEVLWILDGYDEFVQSIPEQLKDVFDHVIGTQHHVLTSRPYAVVLPYDIKMEIIGFTDDNIPKYINQFFDQIKDKMTNASSECQKLRRFLKNNSSIWGIAHIPVNLELICNLWANNDWSETKTLTMTTLYDNITEWLCKRYLTRQKINHDGMTKQSIYKECEAELRFLETLAFKGMECNKIIIPPQLLEETEEETQCFLNKHSQLLNLGILKSYDHEIISHGNQSKKQHYFVHLSFQEHFAARHLLKTLKIPNHREAIDFINNHKYNSRFQLVFIFASGLLAQSAYKSSTEAFWTNIQGEPRDLVGLKHIKLIIECIDELGHQNIFGEHVNFLNDILQWLVTCIRADSSILVRNLSQSLQRTNSLLSKHLIQNKMIHLLVDADVSIKRKTLDILSKVTISEPIPKLISTLHAALRDEDSVVRHAACEALGKMGEKAATDEVIAALLDTLRHENSDVGQGACKALGNMGEKAATDKVIAALLDVLRDQDSVVRPTAYELLGNIAEKAATNQMIAVLLSVLQNPDPKVRQGACEVIRKIDVNAARNVVIAGLLKALCHKKSHVQQGACEAFGSIGEKAATNEVIAALVNELLNKHSVVRHAACEALGKMGEKAATNDGIAGLLNALRNERLGLRREACEVFGKMGEKAATNEVIAGLMNALLDGYSDFQWEAYEALNHIRGKAATNEVIATLLNALQDPDSDVRRRAWQFLGKMGEKAETNEVIAALLNALRHETPDVRRAACEVLEKMGEKAATNAVITALFDALRDPDSKIRQIACEVIWKIDKNAATNEVIATLFNALQDPDSDVRRRAWQFLGKMGEKAATNEVIAALLNALRDIDPDTRMEAYEVLGKIGEQAAMNEVIADLLSALRDKNLGVRREACEAFGKLGEKAATNEVITGLLIAVHDTFSSVGHAACEALGKMGEKAATNEVIATLLNALRDSDSDVRWRAWQFLGKMGEKAATNAVITALFDALRHKDPNIRRGACEALGKVGEKAATNQMISGLGNALNCMIHDGYYDEIIAVLKVAGASHLAMEQLDTNMIEKLQWHLRSLKHVGVGEVREDLWVKLFLETKNTAWIPLVKLAALLQGVAITTVENRIIIYATKGPLELPVHAPELMQTFVEGFNGHSGIVDIFYSFPF